MKIIETTATKATLVKGATACGKTDALVEQVAKLVDEGAEPSSIAVYAASPQAAFELRERLTVRLGEVAEGLAVTTPREEALKILSTDAAMAATGRRPRILTTFEQNAFFEDMKTTATKPGRIKDILAFFYRSWTVCDDFHDAWLVNDEERGLHAAAKGYLAMTAGMLEAEVSNYALRFVLSDAAERAARSHDHVLCDDYQLLSRASQLLVNALARKSICVAANPNDVLRVFESFPYADGVEEFLTLNKNAEVVELASGKAEVAGDVRAFPSATEEVDAVVEAVKSALEAGVDPHDVYVVTPHKVLQSVVVRMLGKAGVPAETLTSDRVLSNDLRDMTRCKNARFYTLLALVADANDAVAWRSWCGFGDALLYNSAFMALRGYCETAGTDMLGALHALALARVHGGEEGFCADDALLDLSGVLGMEDVVSAYMRGRVLLKRVAGLKGQELLDAVENAVSLEGEGEKASAAVLAQLMGPVCEVDTPASILGRINERLMLPRFESKDGERGVRVGTAAQMCGIAPRIVVMTGMLNGLTPSRACLDGTLAGNEKRERLMGEARMAYGVACGKAREQLVQTYFEESDADLAAMLDAKVARIRLRDGERVCKLEPSCLLG